MCRNSSSALSSRSFGETGSVVIQSAETRAKTKREQKCDKLQICKCCGESLCGWMRCGGVSPRTKRCGNMFPPRARPALRTPSPLQRRLCPLRKTERFRKVSLSLLYFSLFFFFLSEFAKTRTLKFFHEGFTSYYSHKEENGFFSARSLSGTSLLSVSQQEYRSIDDTFGKRSGMRDQLSLISINKNMIHSEEFSRTC